MRKSGTISKSASAPSLLKEKRAATQAYLAAVGTGNTHAMRTLGLECGAELSGIRAYDIHGNSSHELLAQLSQFTPQQKLQVKRQFLELPRLIGAVDAARTGNGGSSASGATVLPKLVNNKAQTQTQGFRELRMTSAMATLGASFREPELAYTAALSNPRLLKVAPESVGPVLQALTASLKSERLAAQTIKRNPAILKRDAKKIQQVVPVLMGMMPAEDVAYTLTVQPEVLEVDFPQQLRKTVSTIGDILGNFGDALWLVVQSIVPASIVVSTRAWNNEELVGEFARMLGVRSKNRPVYKKPAQTLHHHGSQVRDMYLFYDEGSWIFTADFNEHAAAGAGRTRTTSFKHAATHAPPSSQLVLGELASERLSPDQAAGVWNVFDGGKLEPDQYFLVADGGATRGKNLLVVAPPAVRRAHNHLKEAVGPFWLEGSPGGAAKGTRFIGNLRQDDVLHSASAAANSGATAGASAAATGVSSDGSAGAFAGLGDFTPKKGYSYIQTTLEARAAPLVLTAWEPIVVFLMFYGDDNPKDDAQEDDDQLALAAGNKKRGSVVGAKAESKSNAGSKSGSNAGSKVGSNAGSKAGSNAGSKAGSTAASKAGSKVASRKNSGPSGNSGPSAASIGMATGFCSLQAGGWLPFIQSAGGLKLPVLREVGAITKVFSRGSLRGRVEIPPHFGRGPPPLIFVRAEVAARDADLVPCEAKIPARPGEAIFSGVAVCRAPGKRRNTVDHGANIEAGEINVRLGDVDDPDMPRSPCLDVLGDFSYSEGYSLVRPRFPTRTHFPSDIQIVIDTAVPIRVVIAWFHGTKSLDEEQAHLDGSDHTSPPPWVEAERWRPIVTRNPLILLGDRGQVKASFIYTKDFEPGEIPICGSGAVMPVLLWQSRGDRQPDLLQRLLPRRPAVLAAGDTVSFLKRHLRVELGNAVARQALLQRSEEWARLCETGGLSEVEAWVYSLKMASFATELHRSASQVKALAERTAGLAAVTLPQLSECCAVLGEGLGGSHAMLAVVSKVPELLTVDATTMRQNLEALKRMFYAKPAVYRVCKSHPRLLLKDGQMETIFGKLMSQHPDIAQQRLQKTSGEWARWPDMVGQDDEVLASWFGRIMAEERSAASRDRVELVGFRRT